MKSKFEGKPESDRKFSFNSVRKIRHAGQLAETRANIMTHVLLPIFGLAIVKIMVRYLGPDTSVPFWFFDASQQRYRSVDTDATLERIHRNKRMRQAKLLLQKPSSEKAKLQAMRICRDETEKIFRVRGLDIDQSSRLFESFGQHVEQRTKK
jgi:hypothetical protein